MSAKQSQKELFDIALTRFYEKEARADVGFPRSPSLSELLDGDLIDGKQKFMIKITDTAGSYFVLGIALVSGGILALVMGLVSLLIPGVGGMLGITDAAMTTILLAIGFATAFAVFFAWNNGGKHHEYYFDRQRNLNADPILHEAVSKWMKLRYDVDMPADLFSLDSFKWLYTFKTEKGTYHTFKHTLSYYSDPRTMLLSATEEEIVKYDEYVAELAAKKANEPKETPLAPAAREADVEYI